MTIRECMDAVLQLLNQYSIAGAVVPLSYDDQADTENRMLNLINAAQSEIAATVKPISKTLIARNDAFESLVDRFGVPYLPPDSSFTLTTKDGKPGRSLKFRCNGTVRVSVGATDYGEFTGEYETVNLVFGEPTSEITFTTTTTNCTVTPIYFYEEAMEPDAIPKPHLGYNAYELPKDCNYTQQINFASDNGDVFRSNVHKWLDDNTLLFPKEHKGMLSIVYARYAKRFTEEDDKLTTQLDNTPDTHEAIPYYAAAVIAQDENPSAYAALFNLWETKLARLGYKPPRVEFEDIEDVYGPMVYY